MDGRKMVRVYGAGLLLAGACGLTAFDAHAVRVDNIEVKVTPSTDSLSYGKPGTYTFYVANFTNGNINNIRFRATLSAGEFAESNPINAGAPAVCTRVISNPQQIDCSITGGIESFGFSTFDFAFTAPASGTQVNLSWNVRFGQGAATNFIASTLGDNNPPNISLIVNSETRAKAYIPPTGDNLFTGDAIPDDGDRFTVNVLVDPAVNKVIIAGITEVECGVGHKCAQLEVDKKVVQSDGTLRSVKAEFTGTPTTDLDKRLVFVFRLAALEVAGKSISQAYILYTPDPTFANPNPTPHQVLDCPKRQPNYAPLVGQPPCLARKIEYTKRTAPSANLIGVWELELWASRNGFIDVAF